LVLQKNNIKSKPKVSEDKMPVLINNLIYLFILVFAAGFVALGLVSVIKVLKGDISPGAAATGILVGMLAAALVIWAAYDFMNDRILVQIVGTWFQAILNESIGG
jgi:hypothetical protein